MWTCNLPSRFSAWPHYVKVRSYQSNLGTYTLSVLTGNGSNESSHTETFYATADTHVSTGSSSASTNNGAAQGLYSGQVDFGGSQPVQYYAFLKFDLSSIPSSAQITEAKLHFVTGRNSVPCNTGTVSTVTISEVLSSWTEYGLTFLNMPSQYKYINAQSGFVFGDCSSNPYSIDVIDAVGDWVNLAQPNNGLLLKASNIQNNWGESQDYCTIYSKEVSQTAGPYLVVKYVD